MKKPETVLVIGFGVGNTTQAATLHRSITRVEVADLSRDILASAGYFSDVNHEVLRDPRVVIYVWISAACVKLSGRSSDRPRDS